MTGSGDRVGDAADIRPWATGITADAPQCHRCTWVKVKKTWKLKFVSKQCPQHRGLDNRD